MPSEIAFKFIFGFAHTSQILIKILLYANIFEPFTLWIKLQLFPWAEYVIQITLNLKRRLFAHAPSWSSDSEFVCGAEGLRFKSRAGQIRHSVADGSPLLQHFIGKSSLARTRNDAEMGLANSLLASAWYGKHNESFDLTFCWFCFVLLLMQSLSGAEVGFLP